MAGAPQSRVSNHNCGRTVGVNALLKHDWRCIATPSQQASSQHHLLTGIVCWPGSLRTTERYVGELRTEVTPFEDIFEAMMFS
jgi:hypothetical protein